jgi:hypothetical protein
MSGLEVELAGRLGGFALEVGFASDGGVTALFGHSGAGKTTVVNMIGGILRPQHGRVVVGGRVLFDAGRGIDLPPHRRRLGHVFQEGRLFPHLSVRRNLLYGAWFAGAPHPSVTHSPGETRTPALALYTFTPVPGGEVAALRLPLVAVADSMAALVASEVLGRRLARRIAA